MYLSYPFGLSCGVQYRTQVLQRNDPGGVDETVAPAVPDDHVQPREQRDRQLLLLTDSPPRCRCGLRQVLHTHLHDLDAAGPLFENALKLSTENPLVQRVSGLFLLASCKFPREESRRKALALLAAAAYR